MTQKIVLAVFVCIVQSCSAISLVGYKIAPNYPDDAAKSTLNLKGLTSPVNVIFDAQGVPHIEATNVIDLARASGFVQGRARFFQMDMMRRLARGRVSEMVGDQPLLSSSTVEYDKVMRGWNIESRANASIGNLTGEDRKVLEVFAEGVNAAMLANKPIEYSLLQLEPEPWTITDSLAVGLLNVWSITHNYQQENTRLLLALAVGLERMEQIYPSEPAKGSRTVNTQDNTNVLPPSVAEELKELFAAPLKRSAKVDSASEGNETLDVLTVSGASNAWAVDGAHTQSGKPMLANDPHLSHLLPGLLLQIHLKGPGIDVIGATVPGLPWVVAGHNQRVGFSATSSMSDVVDLVIEKQIAPGFVAHENGECALTSRNEIIRVRNGSALEERTLTLRDTCNGPLYNDLHPELFPAGSPLVAIRWKPERVESSIATLFELNRASSVEEVGRIVAKLPSTWNTWTVADVDGKIGSFVSGQVPLRPNHRGTFPVPGWLSKYEWNAFASADQLARVVNPISGVVAHANNLMADPTSASFVRLQTDSAPPYRLQRILDLAGQTPKHNVASFKAMLGDIYSLRAERVAPYMLASLKDASLTPMAKEALAALSAWNFKFEADAPQGAIFFVAYRNAVLAALNDELPAPALKFFLAQRYSTATCDSWFENENHVVWNDTRTPQNETRNMVFVKAFEVAVEELAKQFGTTVSQWKWGALHVHRPMHAFGSKDILDGTVNLEKMGAAGELDTVWKSHFDMGNEKAPFKVVAGPAWRMVVDFADVSHGYWVVDTGASGWPLSPHYGDQYKTWRAGELVPMNTNLNELRTQVHGELTLAP
jgi:penicillin G amidase